MVFQCSGFVRLCVEGQFASSGRTAVSVPLLPDHPLRHKSSRNRRQALISGPTSPGLTYGRATPSLRLAPAITILIDAETILIVAEEGVAGTFMGVQQRYALAQSLRFERGDQDEKIWPMQAFVLGVLFASVDGVSLPLIKSVGVLQRFCEVYMPDHPDHKKLALTMAKAGMDPEYAVYKDAGMTAFQRWSASEDDAEKPDDPAKAMGWITGTKSGL